MEKEKNFLKRRIKIDEEENIIYVHSKKIINDKKSLKTGKKLVKKFDKKDISKIVISKKLKNNKELMNKIYSSNITIFDGRWLIVYMLPQIIDYIINYKDEDLNSKSIAILANNISDLVIQNIKYFANICKTLTIVTNSFEKVKRIEQNLYQNEGIMLIVANNKKKSLLKKDIIINFDFSEEEINKYQFDNECTIINIEGDIKIYKKRYTGLNINDYQIDILNRKEVYNKYLENEKGIISQKNKLKEILIDNEIYEAKEVYEALLYRKDNYNNIRNCIIKDNVQIDGLFGINGRFF